MVTCVALAAASCIATGSHVVVRGVGSSVHPGAKSRRESLVRTRGVDHRICGRPRGTPPHPSRVAGPGHGESIAQSIGRPNRDERTLARPNTREFTWLDSTSSAEVFGFVQFRLSTVVCGLAARVPTHNRTESLSMMYRAQAQGLVEYGLIIALVAVLAIAGLIVFGPAVSSLLSNIGRSV